METLDEAREVLNRPLVRELAPEMAESDVAQLLARLLYRAEFVGNVRHIQSLPRDPKDEPYLNLALAGAAEYLVTRDNDLLELNEDHSTEGKQFRQRHQNRLKILTPGEFLGVMKQAEQ